MRSEEGIVSWKKCLAMTKLWLIFEGNGEEMSERYKEMNLSNEQET